MVHNIYWLIVPLVLLLTGSPAALLQSTDVPLKKKFATPVPLTRIAQTTYYTKVRNAYSTKYHGNITYFPEQFIIKLPHAKILGDRGMVITANNRPFFDYVSELNNGFHNWKIDQIKLSLELNYTNHVEYLHGSLVSLASPGEGCYYHWMFDILPRLQTVAMSKTPYEKIFVGGVERAYKKETLACLGITPANIIYGREKTLIKPDSIIIPSMPHLNQFTRPTWACDFVRSLFLDNNRTETALPRKKLYISRKKVSMRNSQRIIINEDDVVRFLAARGFEKVVLENLSVKKQTELFNAAEIIVAAHGASLTNLVFCDSHAPVTVVEMYQPQWINTCYTSLTEQLNQDRGFQFKHIRLFTSTEKLSKQDRTVRNLYVELDALEKALSPYIPSLDAQPLHEATAGTVEPDSSTASPHTFGPDSPFACEATAESGVLACEATQESLEHFGLVGQESSDNINSDYLEGCKSISSAISNIHDFTGTLESYDLLRSTFLNNRSPHKQTIHGKKLYITHEKLSCQGSPRIIINEHNLIKHLESKGFVTVVLEELTIQEQAQLFNNAKTIVAADGASLTNLIFCDPEHQVNVIEIYNPHAINEYYSTLTRQLNTQRNFKFNHTYIPGSTDKLSEEEHDIQKILVELDQLDRTIEATEQ